MTDTSWYLAPPADATEEWADVCGVMQALAEHDEEMLPDEWRAFARYVHETALDQECYGEAINADPSLLETMWAGFLAGWTAKDAS